MINFSNFGQKQTTNPVHDVETRSWRAPDESQPFFATIFLISDLHKPPRGEIQPFVDNFFEVFHAQKILCPFYAVSQWFLGFNSKTAIDRKNF